MTRKIIGHARINRNDDEQAEKSMFFMDVMAALEAQFTKNELEFFFVQSDSQLHKKIKTSAKLIQVKTEPNDETKLKQEEERGDLIFKNISTNIFEDRKQQIAIKQSVNRQRIPNQREFLNTPKSKIKQKVFVTKKMQNINRKMKQNFDLFGSFSPIADSIVPSHFPFNTQPYSMDIQKRCRTHQRSRPRQVKQTFGPDCIPVRLMTGVSLKRTERLRDSGEASMRDKMRCFGTEREWFRFSEQA